MMMILFLFKLKVINTRDDYQTGLILSLSLLQFSILFPLALPRKEMIRWFLFVSRKERCVCGTLIVARTNLRHSGGIRITDSVCGTRKWAIAFRSQVWDGQGI